MSAIIQYLTRIRFGEGAIDDLAEELNLLGIQLPLIITDPGLSTSDMMVRVQNAIASTPFQIYDGTSAPRFCPWSRCLPLQVPAARSAGRPCCPCAISANWALSLLISFLR